MVKLFVDIDGTIASWDTELSSLDELYKKGYFLNRPVMENMLEAVRLLARDEELETYIISSVFEDSHHIITEKQGWLDRYIPEIPKENRFFSIYGKSKRESVPFPLNQKCFLLDDYTLNLMDWEKEGQGIKVLNGINHTRKSWQGPFVDHSMEPQQISKEIKKIIANKTLA